jgi:lysophospholipase L1-like esterase
MSPRTTFLRRLAGAASVPLAMLGVLTGPASATPAAAAPDRGPDRAYHAPLRVMPLGDSITFGVGSETVDGYRSDLYQRLTAAGLDVDFVGSLRQGTGPDGDHEGHKGWTIQRLAVYLDRWLTTYQPDVILLHIGTNDMVRNIPGAAGKLDRMLHRIATVRPDTEVFVAQIVGLGDYPGVAAQQARTAAYNRAVARIVAEQGDRFHLVDQSGVHGVDMFNKEHPNDAGYGEISWNWYRAMEPVLGGGAESWPAGADPDRARVSYRCIDASILDPAVAGCHYWYHREAYGSQVWMLPVRERVRYRVRVDGHLVTKARIVTRWVTAA